MGFFQIESGCKVVRVSSELVHLVGTVSNLSLSFMIDSGASHNYISYAQCKRLGLTTNRGEKI